MGDRCLDTPDGLQAGAPGEKTVAVILQQCPMSSVQGNVYDRI
jgi:hypothetical protein